MVTSTVILFSVSFPPDLNSLQVHWEPVSVSYFSYLSQDSAKRSLSMATANVRHKYTDLLLGSHANVIYDVSASLKVGHIFYKFVCSIERWEERMGVKLVLANAFATWARNSLSHFVFLMSFA